MSSVLERFVFPPVNMDRNAVTLTDASGQLIFELSVRNSEESKNQVLKNGRDLTL